MKPLLLLCLLPLLLIGCASKKGTTLYNPRTGGLLAEFHADMDESEFRAGAVYWKVKGHYPSANTKARGTAYSQVLGVVGKQAQMFTVPGVRGPTGNPEPERQTLFHGQRIIRSQVP